MLVKDMIFCGNVKCGLRVRCGRAIENHKKVDRKPYSVGVFNCTDEKQDYFKKINIMKEGYR